MTDLSTSYRAATLYRQERLAQAARWQRAQQAAPRAGASRVSVQALTATVRYARYLVSSLAAVAFGLMLN